MQIKLNEFQYLDHLFVALQNFLAPDPDSIFMWSQSAFFFQILRFSSLCENQLSYQIIQIKICIWYR